MTCPDMRRNQFKGKQGFLSLFPEMTRTILMLLNLIKWLQQRQFGGELLPPVVDLIEEKQLLKASPSVCLFAQTDLMWEIFALVLFQNVHREPILLDQNSMNICFS